MAYCLYHPESGYYMSGAERTGRRGDYFTSPDLHPIFARLVARQAAEMWEILDRPSPCHWVEMGPGRGLFAGDFLEWTRSHFPGFFDALSYVLIEPCPKSRQCLADQLARQACLRRQGFEGRVLILSDLDQLSPVTGCFFSNELVDSFPIALVTRARGRLREIYVALEGESLREKLGPISDPEIAASVARYAHELDEGGRVEVNRQAVRWLRGVAEKLNRGFVVTIDYGDLADRLYTPDRPQGTLLAYKGHRASQNFFSAPGEQDLTAHVNFSALIDAGREASLELTGFTTQERFLMALGEEDQFGALSEPETDERKKLGARLKLKRLIHPEGMGGIFKVLVQHRGVLSAQAGTRPELIGLKFARSA